MRRLAMLLLAALPAFAGTVIDYDCHAESSAPYSFTTRLSIDGKNARYDVLEGAHPVFNPKISVISRDEGETLIIIDHRLKTYFVRTSREMSGPLSTWKAPGVVRTTKVSFDVQRYETTDTVAGYPVRKFTARASYELGMKVEDEKLSAAVSADATFWALERRNDALPFGIEFAFKSGVESLDHKIGVRLPRIGIPLKQTVVVTRTISGGQPITERFAATATNVSDVPLDLAIFQPPRGYQFREPAFGFE